MWDNEGATFYFDVGEVVRFRVEAEEWHDQIPNAPDQLEPAAVSERRPPYSIVVSYSVVFIFISLPPVF
jgi:DNA-directed RNA polymerase III subunit RPC8